MASRCVMCDSCEVRCILSAERAEVCRPPSTFLAKFLLVLLVSLYVVLQLGLHAVRPSNRTVSGACKGLLKELQKVSSAKDAMTAHNATLEAQLLKEKSSKTELQEDLHMLYVQLLEVIEGKQVCTCCRQASTQLL